MKQVSKSEIATRFRGIVKGQIKATFDLHDNVDKEQIADELVELAEDIREGKYDG